MSCQVHANLPARRLASRLVAAALIIGFCTMPGADGTLAQSAPAPLPETLQVPAAPELPSDADPSPGTPQAPVPASAGDAPPAPSAGAAGVAQAELPADLNQAGPAAGTQPQEPVTEVDTALKFLADGGPSIWAIAALAVITLALILWKTWRLALAGAWSTGKAGKAVTAYEGGDTEGALSIVAGRIGIRSRIVFAALTARRSLPEDRAREETARVAKKHIADAGTGLGALELIATIAPLLGLLGTVLGMIAAFQALEQAGAKADPSLLAGGIWEALLTTAAGMAVAIPASAALTWFEAVINRIRRDVEDAATRIFVAGETAELKLAAE